MPTPSRITVRDIAAKAGLHFTTVALALRDSPMLNAETKRRVQELAESMGYRPDPMLTALNAYRKTRSRPNYQATIAWINNWPVRAELLRIPEFGEYHRGACARAAELGYVVEEFWLHARGMTPDKLRRVLSARGIQAVIIAPQPKPGIWIDFDYSEFSALALGYSLQPTRLHVITNHHAHSMNMMIERLYGLGYRRIGMYIGKEWDAKVGHSWLSSFLLARWLHPDLADLPPVLQNDLEGSALEEWLERHRPDVVVSYGRILDQMKTMRLKIPKDIGYAGIDLLEQNRTVSGIYQNSVTIGRKAVDFLVDMIHRGERGLPAVPIRTLVESEWRIGTTVRTGTPKPRTKRKA
ncbi:LacI family DNA-binding transcriptional regulator [Rariglobus hedericola]|uniref:LacI family transcriptional regulator n=1 Tax=Rariglobus hedericola TaxID=2597822 RepID=A0A556QSB3_9BACT|nr:LacI family DNA-binding transcriptional regulator [Rariglobus hedericola]TSJ79534.1 LacI family transcriptional regulator [Rariglobus hedericola]